LHLAKNLMARNMTSECLKAFFEAIAIDKDLKATCLGVPTDADACHISKLHEEKHSITCMLLSLDCLHVL